jgi:hypothetical protein
VRPTRRHLLPTYLVARHVTCHGTAWQDRVEASPEQMARCTAHAERLSREKGHRVRVVGGAWRAVQGCCQWGP